MGATFAAPGVVLSERGRPSWAPLVRFWRLAVATSACLALVLQAGRAGAAPAWLAPVTVAEETQEVAFGPYVAMDAQGDVLATWEGSGARNETSRPAGGSWQEAGSLAGEGRAVSHPCVGASSAGEDIALWAIWSGKRRLLVQSALQLSGSSWQAPEDLAEVPEILRMSDCHVAIDPKGDAVAVWALETVFEFEEVWAAYRPAGGLWQTPVELRGAINPAASPDVAIDPHGDAAAVWIGRSFVIQGAYKPAGSDWQEPQSPTESETLSELGHSASNPQVAFDAAGDSVAAWDLATGESEVVQASFRATAGQWQTPVDLSGTSQDAYVYGAAMDAQGDALTIWDLVNGAHGIIQSASRPTGGPWQGPVDVSKAGGEAYAPQLAVDSDGDAVAVWEAQSGEHWSVQSAVKPAGESWQAPLGISQASTHGELFPQVAIDSHGDAVAAWELYSGAGYLIQAAGYQAAGPQLDSLAIPSIATVAAPVSFSVSPLDVWAGLGATRWNFGDGSSATGTSVAHVYASAGVYDVTLTSGDALGNTTSTAGKVTVLGSGPPDFGRCQKVARGEGKYKTSACDSLASSGSYEWTPEVQAAASFTSEGGKATLETVGKTKISCAGERAKGEYTGPRTVGDVVITLTGCESSTHGCASAGAAEGELVTNPLEGVLGWEKHADELEADRVALDLLPEGQRGHLLDFKCATRTFAVEGSVLASIKDDATPSLTTRLKYSASKGKQRPERFEGEPTDVLMTSVEEGPPEQSALKLTSTLSSTEQLEVNAFA